MFVVTVGLLLLAHLYYLANMVLKMVLADQEIDSVSIETHRLNQVGYLEAMMECLRAKHGEVLSLTTAQAQFYLQVASSMNNEGFASGD